MIDFVDLKSVKISSNLSDAMLEKLNPITVLKRYENNDYIIIEGDYAEYLFSVIKGKVVLEINVHSSNPVRVKDITEFKSFGISSVADTENRTDIADARAIEDTTVLLLEKQRFGKTVLPGLPNGLPFHAQCGQGSENPAGVQAGTAGAGIERCA